MAITTTGGGAEARVADFARSMQEAQNVDEEVVNELRASNNMAPADFQPPQYATPSSFTGYPPPRLPTREEFRKMMTENPEYHSDRVEERVNQVQHNGLGFGQQLRGYGYTKEDVEKLCKEYGRAVLFGAGF